MINSTDICINFNKQIYVSRDLTYGQRKKPAAVHVAASAIADYIDAFHTLLDLPSGLNFRIARIKGSYSGKYASETKTVIISPLFTWDSLINTLAHELVHAEQYHQGRLAHVFHKKKGWLHHWKGELNTSKGKTYNSYRNQPWEIEAFDRAPVLVRQVNKI